MIMCLTLRTTTTTNDLGTIRRMDGVENLWEKKERMRKKERKNWICREKNRRAI